ncbi:srs domain-containing protein [Neospora caninum Liverpool]|uniref:Srs domain-containing protein n=1 Tax=Neospora caninum (strain Liverpool) TaxID=572307 RepID=F0VCF9_NEOCL|nr:srs domain-containing protein [Neospora caninum Liverpool]CBZ51281.1 srs domain-containing protein [Neospora caninum Liverpool]CEL68596.1 TPA: SRS domain-containing protein [Neospora caninum Liverpool]|eukprot:XP_003881314.1 srs domain-containing protein [Neospora caninum Liverpool]
MERRISFSKSRAPVGLVAAVLFVSYWNGLWTSAVTGTAIHPQCTIGKTMTTCTCRSSPGVSTGTVGAGSSATLSESSNAITIQCSDAGFEFVPAAENHVCTSSEEEKEATPLKSCKENQGEKISPITDFLSHVSDTNPPAWTKTDGDTKDNSLTIPPNSFPLTDKSFFAGCRKSTNNNDECVVNVSVKARTSAVKDGVLTCAYGKESNSSVPEVTLNSENNSLTIQCGSEGQMEPTQQSLTAYHCAGSNTTDCKKVNLTEIMPTFTSSWWTTDEQNSKAPKLVIPEDGFPAQEEAIVLGCNQNNNVASRAEEVDGPTAAALPTCRVKVTLSAQTSGSQASNDSFLGLFVLSFIPYLMGAC